MTANDPFLRRLLPATQGILVVLSLVLAAVMFVAVPALAVTNLNHGWRDALVWVWPFVLVFIGLSAMQYIALCTWRLVALVRADRIFSDEARRPVDGIVRAMVTGWVCLAALGPWVGYVAFHADAPGLIVIGGVVGLVATAILLLMLVLRELLNRATVQRVDLDGVI